MGGDIAIGGGLHGAAHLVEPMPRPLPDTPDGGLGIDLTPHAGASLGNIATYANAGLTLRLGNDLRP